MSFRERLPDYVRMRAESLGQQGLVWMETLDDCVASLEQDWNMTAGNVLSGGSESLVAHCITDSGSEAILKVGLAGSADLGAEAAVYSLANGRGYARLLAFDEPRNAMLLEQLGQSLASRVADPQLQLEVICSTLKTAWRQVDQPGDLMTGAEKAHWLADFIESQWQQLNSPFSTAVLQRVLAFCEQRADAHASAALVLVHGDAHAENTLLVPGAGETYKFVDPDGLLAERACDLAVPMRDWVGNGDKKQVQDGALRWCEQLAALTDVEPLGIWQWGFMERVSTACVMKQIGMDGADALLEVAERVCELEAF